MKFWVVCGWLQEILGGFGWFWMVSDGFGWFLDGFKWFAVLLVTSLTWFETEFFNRVLTE